MLLYLSLIGIFLSVLLVYFNARKFTSTIYLGVFFFLTSLYALNEYALLYSNSVLLISIIITNFAFLHYLIGPMLYWYTRSVLTDNSRLKKTDFLHLLPMIVYLIAALPYIFTPYSFKVEIAKAILDDLGTLSRYNFTVLSEIFSIPVIYLSRPILILVYTFWSIGLFIRYIIRKEQLFVLSGQNFMIKWLSALLGFQLLMVVTHWLAIYLSFMRDSNVFFTINSIQFLSGAGMVGLLCAPFFFPGILYGLPRLPQPIYALQSIEVPAGAKKSIPNFEADYILAIEQKADACMKELQPYLQPDFNLAQFAVLIQFPIHHVAYYFREVKKQSFSDYRNMWRIENAKKLITEGKASGLTLEAIGLQSGFATRNTFLTAFKRAEGISPNTFVAQITK